jgi:choline dehydrogenase
MEDNEAGGDDFRGKGGPLFISANRTGLHPLVKSYVHRPAARRVWPLESDFNGASRKAQASIR